MAYDQLARVIVMRRVIATQLITLCGMLGAFAYLSVALVRVGASPYLVVAGAVVMAGLAVIIGYDRLKAWREQ